MNKVTIKKIPFKLNKEVITKGSNLDFKVTDKDGKDVQVSDIIGLKIISVFPDINTRICDAQTQKIARWAHFYPQVNFVSVTMDKTEVIQKWCAAHGVENVNIYSDHKYKDFGKATGLYIKKARKLARGIIILNGEGKVLDIAIKSEVAEDPNYKLVEKYLK